MARHRLGRSGVRNTLYSRNPLSRLPSYWEVVSLLGSCKAFKSKAGERERERRKELKKDIAGRQGITWVVPGHFWDRRTQTLILSEQLGCMVTGSQRTRFLGHSLNEGESSSEAALQEERKEDPRSFGGAGWPLLLTGKGTHCKLPEEEIFRFLLREDNGSAFGEEKHIQGMKCARCCTQVLRSRVLRYCTFSSASPGQAPSGLLLSIIPVVQQLSCSLIK